MSKRHEIARSVDAMVKGAFGADASVSHINYGDGHRRIMLWNRRYERALRRSQRNQPPKAAT